MLAGVIAGLVGAAFAPWWIGRFVGTGLLVGVLLELPFLITRYRRWDPWMFYVSAAFSGLVLAIAVFIGLGAEHYAWWAWAIALPLWVASPVFFTWIGRVIAARLARAGVAQLPSRRRGRAEPRAGEPAETRRADASRHPLFTAVVR